MNKLIFSLVFCFLLAGCKDSIQEKGVPVPTRLTPEVVTTQTKHDTDDPAIWIHPEDPGKSLIIGTDKDEDGALYVFDLAGNIVEDKVVRNLRRPNNVDLEYGVRLGDTLVDIVVVTERLEESVRIFEVPSMRPLDGGGLKVFEGEEPTDWRAPMGIGIYRDARTEETYLIVGRKHGPREGYLWQYRLTGGEGHGFSLEKERSFGAFSGKQEIEAIAVDDAHGHVYYSDEMSGIRKYFSHPDSGNQEIAMFGQEAFAEDREGISVYAPDDSTGYIIVSDQQADCFRIFDRTNPNHPLVAVIPVSTHESDGSEVVAVSLGSKFPQGLFVAMSDDRTFQYYDWRSIEAEIRRQVGIVSH